MPGDVPAGINDPSSVAFLSGSATPLAYTDLSSDELTIFDADLKRLASIWSRYGPLANLWLEDRDTFLWGASIAKAQLSNIQFRGLRALGGGVFGMQPLRSIYINATQTWQASYTTTGWTSKTWNVNLNTTTGTAQNTQNRVVLLASRYVNYAAVPKVKELRNIVGPTTYPVEVLEWAFTAGLFISKTVGAVLVSKNSTFSTDLNVEFQGVDATALWGLAYGTGDWMNSET